MTNHVHLLISPENSSSISELMKVVCSRYAQLINKKYSRSGTLWEGRHKASAVDADSYLLKCYRYIELNPVAANMVSRPEEYVWSSHHANAWGDVDSTLTPHASYLGLGRNKEQRLWNYRELFSSALSPEDIHEFREAAHYSMPVGTDYFKQQIESKLGRKLGYRGRGRPAKLAD